MGGGELLRMRVPVPPHLVGKPVNSLERAGQGHGRSAYREAAADSCPRATTMQNGDYLGVVLVKDGMDLLDEQLAAPAEHH